MVAVPAAPLPANTTCRSSSRLPTTLRRIDQGRQDDDGRSVLVVVHHRNVERFDQPLFDFEAARRRDILEVDAAEDRRDPNDGLDDFVDVLRIEANRKRVDTGELPEQHRFAFHHRQRAERADVAESEDGRAVRHDRNGVAFDRQLKGFARVGCDRHRNARDAGRVDGREILPRLHRNLRLDANLAAEVREERRVRCADDARAFDALEGFAHFGRDRVRRNVDRDVANDARLRHRVHVDRSDGTAGVADRIGQQAERAGLVRHLEAHDERKTDRRLGHVSSSFSFR